MGNIITNFDIEEFVPPEVFKDFGMNSKWFINKIVVNLAQFIRDYFEKTVTINNWSYWKPGMGGNYKERGFRLPDSKTGAKLSQHRLGNACDFSIKGLTADEVRAEIMKFGDEFLDVGLTTMESAQFSPTWCHIDCRNTGLNKILIVGK